MNKEDIPLFQALQGQNVRDVEMMIVPQQGTARMLLATGQAIIAANGEKQVPSWAVATPLSFNPLHFKRLHLVGFGEVFLHLFRPPKKARDQASRPGPSPNYRWSSNASSKPPMALAAPLTNPSRAASAAARSSLSIRALFI